MSRTLGAPRWGLNAALAGVLALVLAAFAALGLASQANAAFSTGKCAGENIIGRGASFARDAHKVFNDKFKLVYCIGTPGAGTINVTYEAQGSGAGRQSVKIRDGAPRFGMTDEPPVSSEINEMNSGVTIVEAKNVIDSDPSNDGKIHVVPAAVGAVAPLVNFPNGCDVTLLDAASRTSEEMGGSPGSEFPLGLVRVRFTKDEFEKIWAKDSTHDNWVEVFPELVSDTDCNKPIIRIVRFDDSGTSFAFKDNLNTINEGRDWLGAFAATSPKKTREWPNATFGDRDDCGDKDGIIEASDPDGPGAPGLVGDTDQLASACFNGNQGIVDTLIATDGSVGYSDISTARNNVAQSLAIKPRTKADDPFDNDIYWTQIPSGPGAGTFQEATADAKGFRTDGTPGSNCQSAQFVNKAGGGLPSTLQDWSKVSGVNSTGAYAVCTLTYGLVFDDNADVWGNTPSEETKARTVKDYWDSILSVPTQAALFDKDYSPLPGEILTIAQAGIASVDWNKGEGGGGKEEGGKKEDGDDKGGTTTPPTVKPSNAFTLLRKTISSKTGGATLSVKLPGAGRLEMVATAKSGKKTIKVASAVLNANQAGTFNVPLKVSGAAKKVLRAKGKLPVKLELTFTPTGGDPNETSSSLVLKMKKPAKRS